MGLTDQMTTADLPSALYVDPATLEAARAARAAGLTLARTADRCTPQRENCPSCLAAAVRGLVPA